MNGSLGCVSIVCTEANATGSRPWLKMKTLYVSEVRVCRPVVRRRFFLGVAGFLGGVSSLGCEFSWTHRTHRLQSFIQGIHSVLDCVFLVPSEWGLGYVV